VRYARFLVVEFEVFFKFSDKFRGKADFIFKEMFVPL
jgi:hypothetical protein